MSFADLENLSADLLFFDKRSAEFQHISPGLPSNIVCSKYIQRFTNIS